MSPAALSIRGRSLAGLLLILTGPLPPGIAAESAPRAVPTRPATPRSLPTTRIGGVEWVTATDLAKHLGLKCEISESGKRARFSDGRRRAAFESDNRECTVDGLRIFLGDPARTRGGELHVSRIDAERCLTPLLRPGLGVAVPSAPRIIAIDPGHGGRFAGTENPRLGLQEKHLALDVAGRLRKLLEAAGYQVVMTRTADTEIAPSLEADIALRGEIANRARADLFVSIHFNSLPNDTKTSGSEIYTFAPAGQRSSNSWGSGRDDAEPAASPVNRHDHWSVVLAQAVQRNVLAILKTVDRGKKINQLGALRRLDCPGVLVESAFLSNDAEARRVATPAFRQQIAEAIASGVRDYAVTLAGVRAR
ncbi:MAG: N-acetylmuramoyl-L-alanine amidase [Verrucomicrobia bacterium]|nr:N-acetylmuramoyl-L-alanine amidase [Verrucomicrobiota bacterium]